MGDRQRAAIVIGAGPAGLACALGLSSVCRRVHLVERHAAFEKRGATFGLARNGQRALEELSPGCMKRLRDIGLEAGSTLVFVWWEMRDVLLQFVRRQSNIVELHCGEEFTEIDDVRGGIKVFFQSGLELEGDFVVGADGVHSTVRDLLGLAPRITSHTTLWRGSFNVPDTASADLKGCLAKDMVPLAVDEQGKVYFVLFNFHRRHPGRLAWIFSTSIDVRKKDADDDKITPFTLIDDHVTDEKSLQLMKEVLNLSDDNHLQPYPETSIIDLSNEALSSYEDGGWGGNGRITLIGDAAHGMRPTDGYGGSMAMEDAVVLTRILQTAAKPESSEPEPEPDSNGEDEKFDDFLAFLNGAAPAPKPRPAPVAVEAAPSTPDPAKKPPNIQHLLRAYESERLPRVKKVYENQCERYNIRMQEGKRPGPQTQEFMDWLLAGV